MRSCFNIRRRAHKKLVSIFNKYTLMGFIFLLGVLMFFTPLKMSLLSIVDIICFSLFCIFQFNKNRILAQPALHLVKGFLELKNEISFYPFLKNQIEYACKKQDVDEEILILFDDFLCDKLKVIEQGLQKINEKEKQMLCVWIFAKKLPKELTGLLAKYQVQSQEKEVKPSSFVSKNTLVIKDEISGPRLRRINEEYKIKYR